MKSEAATYNSRREPLLTGTALFILGFLWFYFPAEYVLIANEDIGLFLTTTDYLVSFLDRPGGVLEYLGVFLNQFLQFRLVGALLLSGVVTAGYFATLLMVLQISGKRILWGLAILTPALMVGMHHYYPHQIYHSMGFILMLCLAAIVPELKRMKRIYILLMVPVLYLVSGGYVWFFCLLVLAIELVRHRRIHLEGILLLTLYPALIIYMGARLLFLDPLEELFLLPLPLGEQYGTGTMTYLFVICMLLLVFLSGFYTRIRFPKPVWRYLPEILIPVAGMILIILSTYNRRNAQFFTIEKLAVREEWEALLDYTTDHPSMNLFGSFYTNLALANEDLLCSHLFHYPQPFGPRGLCFEWDASGEVLRRGSDFFWAIRFVNEAHHWAYESLIIDGFTCRNLIRLIQTELARGNNRIAEKYIHQLDHTLFHRKRADHYRDLLNNPDGVASDPELGSRFHKSYGGDFFTEGADLEKNLRSLLHMDPSNLPALDYLMALLLLEKKVDEVAVMLPGYLDLSEGRMPVLLDECLLVYKITHREDNQTGMQVSQRTILRFEEYTRVLRQYPDQQEAARILFPIYGNTFWFYLNFSSIPSQ